MSAVLVYITGDISRSVETLQEQLALGRLLKDTELQALALNDMGVIAGWTEAAGARPVPPGA